MKVFIELPSWLGDCVMTTPSVESLVAEFPSVKITFFGSKVAISVYKHHPNAISIIEDTMRKSNRVLNIFRLTQNLGEFEYALSFRSSIMSKWLVYNIAAAHKASYKRYNKAQHQVHRYYNFLSSAYSLTTPMHSLKIHTREEVVKTQKILGINPGASYGSAKRYYPEKFAKVINAVSHQFDSVLIFGSSIEKDIANDICKNTQVDNIKNLAGKLTIDKLITTIASLDTFITADSGPMHIASSFGIKTIALFGATNDTDTLGWDKNTLVLKQNTEILECMPCKKRVCPLGHHKCMKNITPQQIISMI